MTETIKKNLGELWMLTEVRERHSRLRCLVTKQEAPVRGHKMVVLSAVADNLTAAERIAAMFNGMALLRTSSKIPKVEVAVLPAHKERLEDVRQLISFNGSRVTPEMAAALMAGPIIK